MVVVVIRLALRTRLRGFTRNVVVVLSVDVLDEVEVLRLTVVVLDEVVVDVLVVVCVGPPVTIPVSSSYSYMLTSYIERKTGTVSM